MVVHYCLVFQSSIIWKIAFSSVIIQQAKRIIQKKREKKAKYGQEKKKIPSTNFPFDCTGEYGFLEKEGEQCPFEGGCLIRIEVSDKLIIRMRTPSTVPTYQRVCTRVLIFIYQLS